MLYGLGHPGRQFSSAKGKPSLALDFMTPGALDPSITFSRASNGTYFNSGRFMAAASADVPRWDYDQSGNLRGLLLESTKTNPIIQNVNASLWSGTAAVLTANAAQAPNGATAATKFAADATLAQHTLIPNNSTIVANSANTFSVYLKATGVPRATILLGDPGMTSGIFATFNLSTGTIAAGPTYTGSGSGGACSITPAINSWYRCVVTGVINAVATSAMCTIYLDNGAGNFFTGDGVNGLYVWGGQLETGAFASSLITTATVAVTRAADLCSVPVGPWYNQAKGSMMIEYMLEGQPSGFNGPMQLVGADPNNDYIDLDQVSGGTETTPFVAVVGLSVSGSGPIDFYGSPIAVPPAVTTRAASAWSQNGTIIGAHNGVATNNSGNATVALPTIANLTIAGAMHFQYPWSLWARTVKYWPRNLGAGELISNTALPAP